jgi:hypothetical protein
MPQSIPSALSKKQAYAFMFFPLICKSNPSGSFTWKLSSVSGRGCNPRRFSSSSTAFLSQFFDGVRDMVDQRRRLHRLPTRSRVARQQKGVAKRHVALLLVVVVRNLHAQKIRVKIARFAIVGHHIGDVIHRDSLKSLALRGGRRRRGRSRQSQAANQLPPVHPALLKVVKQLCDYIFHF